MARSGGFSASNYLAYAAAGILTAAPLTISAWGFTSLLATFQTMAGVFNNTAGSNRNGFLLGVDGSNKVNAQTNGASAQATAISSTAISANTWFHAAAVFASATSRSAYFNGGGKVTDATSMTPSGINRTSIGAALASSVGSPFGLAGTGLLAEVAFWNIALSDADVLALSKGLSPLLVHPEALVAYWPLIGRNSPENNLKSNAAVMSITGSLSQAAHPRIIMPPRRQLII